MDSLIVVNLLESRNYMQEMRKMTQVERQNLKMPKNNILVMENLCQKEENKLKKRIILSLGISVIAVIAMLIIIKSTPFIMVSIPLISIGHFAFFLASFQKKEQKIKTIKNEYYQLLEQSKNEVQKEKNQEHTFQKDSEKVKVAEEPKRLDNKKPEEQERTMVEGTILKGMPNMINFDSEMDIQKKPYIKQ